MKRLTTWFLLLAVFGVHSSASAALIGPTLVALSGTAAPAGGNYSSFLTNGAVLNASGQVAFQSSLSGGTSTNGIFAGTPGSLQTIALGGAATPDGVGNFNNRGQLRPEKGSPGARRPWAKIHIPAKACAFSTTFYDVDLSGLSCAAIGCPVAMRAWPRRLSKSVRCLADAGCSGAAVQPPLILGESCTCLQSHVPRSLPSRSSPPALHPS